MKGWSQPLPFANTMYRPSGVSKHKMKAIARLHRLTDWFESSLLADILSLPFSTSSSRLFLRGTAHFCSQQAVGEAVLMTSHGIRVT